MKEQLSFEEKEKIVLENVSTLEVIKEKLLQLSGQIKNDLPNNKKLFDEYVADTKYALVKERKELDKIESMLSEEKKFFQKLQEKAFDNLDKIAKEKSQGFPWLAKAYADYNYLLRDKLAEYLEHKSNPAVVTAEKVRELARERRIIEKKLRIAQSIIKYYQDLFPFLEDLLGEPEEEILKYILSRNIEERIDEVGEIGIDPVRIYSRLSNEEYQRLTTTERNQRALDNYCSRPKNKWQIGKDYERYIGYIYESKGYNVYYKGILEKFDDLGRDLICKKDNETIIIQCKRWSQHKTIHDKHISYLYGTVMKYSMDYPKEKVSPYLFTTTKLTDIAKEFARYLKITINEEFPFQEYPSIKCNVSYRLGEKIYHLPFDQQYDRTTIEEERNECYVETVAEAEKLGFRRAFRWHGETSNE